MFVGQKSGSEVSLKLSEQPNKSYLDYGEYVKTIMKSGNANG